MNILEVPPSRMLFWDQDEIHKGNAKVSVNSALVGIFPLVMQVKTVLLFIFFLHILHTIQTISIYYNLPNENEINKKHETQRNETKN